MAEAIDDMGFECKLITDQGEEWTSGRTDGQTHRQTDIELPGSGMQLSKKLKFSIFCLKGTSGSLNQSCMEVKISYPEVGSRK